MQGPQVKRVGRAALEVVATRGTTPIDFEAAGPIRIQRLFGVLGGGAEDSRLRGRTLSPWNNVAEELQARGPAMVTEPDREFCCAWRRSSVL